MVFVCSFCAGDEGSTKGLQSWDPHEGIGPTKDSTNRINQRGDFGHGGKMNGKKRAKICGPISVVKYLGENMRVKVVANKNNGMSHNKIRINMWNLHEFGIGNQMDRQRDSFFLWMFLLQTPSYRRMSIAIYGFVWKCWVYSQRNSHLLGKWSAKPLGKWALADIFQVHWSHWSMVPFVSGSKRAGPLERNGHGVVEPRPCFCCLCLFVKSMKSAIWFRDIQ